MKEAEQTVYAVGDSHGRANLLAQLEREIVDDWERRGGKDGVITFPDDYVDRGPRSLDVIEQLKMGFPLLVRYLRGNHDQILLEFLSDPQFGEDWWRLGGIDIAEISVGRRFDRTRFITT